MQTFYNGLLLNVQTMVDTASGGALNNKTQETTYELLEVLASNNYQRTNDRTMPKKTWVLHEFDTFTALSTKISALQKQFIW